MASISTFDIFKIGIGPSSSHTMGPMVAANRFIHSFQTSPRITRIETRLYGSLAKTGRGHATDLAVILGLSGFEPASPGLAEQVKELVAEKDSLQKIENHHGAIAFDPVRDILFLNEQLPFHSNALQFTAFLTGGSTFEKTYYSVGGGFVVEHDEEELASSIQLTYPVDNEQDLQNHIARTGLEIWQVVFQNELCWRNESEVEAKLLQIWHTMLRCAYRGCHSEGVLPGGLRVQRRAATMMRQLLPGGAEYSDEFTWLETLKTIPSTFDNMNQLISCLALAVNEENAAMAPVVTAPTNGAAGVIPAVLIYFLCSEKSSNNQPIFKFLLTAAEIASLFKKGSTISAAMGGCQAEIGVSSAMAAAGLAQCKGASPGQVLCAAEIAMEHHLGLTCDPVKGLVQIPCIERNAMGANKAITACQLALSQTPENARVSLQSVIQSMKETAEDMNQRYKETSEGGLAINVAIPEC